MGSSLVCKTYSLTGAASSERSIKALPPWHPHRLHSLFLQVPISQILACRYHEGIKHGWKYLLPICTPACYTTHAAVQHTVTLLAKLLHYHLHLPQGISSHGALPTEFDPNFLTSRLLGVRPFRAAFPQGVQRAYCEFSHSFAPQLAHADKSWGNCRIVWKLVASH